MTAPYYQDEFVTLYHGDCRDILPRLERVGSLVTDPPYGIYACGGKWGRKADLQWDRSAASNIPQLLDSADEQIVWGGNYFPLPVSRGWLVWYKRDAVPSAAQVELAWTSLDMNARLIDRTISATNPERVGHPTQKPLSVMLWCLGFVSGSVLDPFAGSGTTLVAAKQLNRRAIGIEMEERYCELAARRLSQSVLDLGGAA